MGNVCFTLGGEHFSVFGPCWPQKLIAQPNVFGNARGIRVFFFLFFFSWFCWFSEISDLAKGAKYKFLWGFVMIFETRLVSDGFWDFLIFSFFFFKFRGGRFGHVRKIVIFPTFFYGFWKRWKWTFGLSGGLGGAFSGPCSPNAMPVQVSAFRESAETSGNQRKPGSGNSQGLSIRLSKD